LKLELCISEDAHTRFMLPQFRDTMLSPGDTNTPARQLLTAIDKVTTEDDAVLLQLAEEVLGRSVRHGKFSSARTSAIWQFVGLELFWRGRFSEIDRILQRAIESARPADPSYVGWHQHLLAKTWLTFSDAQLGCFDEGRALAR